MHQHRAVGFVVGWQFHRQAGTLQQHTDLRGEVGRHVERATKAQPGDRRPRAHGGRGAAVRGAGAADAVSGDGWARGFPCARRRSWARGQTARRLDEDARGQTLHGVKRRGAGHGRHAEARCGLGDLLGGDRERGAAWCWAMRRSGCGTSRTNTCQRRFRSWTEFHVKQHLSGVARSLYRATHDLAHPWARARHDEWDTGNLDAVLTALRGHAVQTRRPARETTRSREPSAPAPAVCLLLPVCDPRSVQPLRRWLDGRHARECAARWWPNCFRTSASPPLTRGPA